MHTCPHATLICACTFWFECLINIVFARLSTSMLLWLQCLDESTCMENGWCLDTCMLGSRTSWNFDLPIYTPEWASTLEGSDVGYIPELPNNLVEQHICPHLLQSCDPLVKAVIDDIIPKCVLCGYLTRVRWFVSSTPNYASFRVVKYVLRVFRGCRHMGWVENKVRTKI